VCCYTKRERALKRPLSVLLHQARASTHASTQCAATPSEIVHSSVHSGYSYTKRERPLKRPLSVLLHQARACTQASTQCAAIPSEGVHSVYSYTKRERALKRPLSVLLHQARACTQASTQCAPTPSESVHSSVHSVCCYAKREGRAVKRQAFTQCVSTPSESAQYSHVFNERMWNCQWFIHVEYGNGYACTSFAIEVTACLHA
jgi:hypothetical protein